MKKAVVLSLFFVFAGVSALSAQVNNSETFNFSGETYSPLNQYKGSME